MGTALPTPRDFLTSLLDTLASATVSSPHSHNHNHNQTPASAGGGDRQESNNNNSNPPSNPLKHLSQTSPAHRALLTTLHAVYPSILLPALDVLDRGLAMRVFLTPSPPPHHPPPPHPQKERADAGVEGGRGRGEPTFHIVRSSQYHHQAQSKQGQSKQQTYVVRLHAWSCTCAAFAFSAYPFEGASSTTATTTTAVSASAATAEQPYTISPWAPSRSAQQDPNRNPNLTADPSLTPDPRLDFGGLSIDGSGNGGAGLAAGVPACKHLLACYLAERLGLGLGSPLLQGVGDSSSASASSYVISRLAGREEGAGLVVDL